MSGLPWFGREYSIYFKISSGGGDWLRLAGGWGLVSGCYGFLGGMFVCGGHSAVVGGICGAGSGFRVGWRNAGEL